MIFPEKIPTVFFIGKRTEKNWAKKNLNETLNANLCSNKELAAMIEPSLDLLDSVCPDVSKWFRSEYKNGNVIFDQSTGPEMAKFDFLTEKLYLSKGFFDLIEGEKAKTLAHEYRHSLQNKTKFMRQVIFNMLTSASHPYLVEDEAELFESKIHIALDL